MERPTYHHCLLVVFLVYLFGFVLKEMFSSRAFLHDSDMAQSSALGTFAAAL